MLDLDATRLFHRAIAQRWCEDREAIHDSLADAHARIDRLGARFEQTTPLPTSLSALILSESDEAKLREIAETLHRLVETAMTWLFDAQDRLSRYFSDHERLFPYLKRAANGGDWQGYSRYDAVFTPEGQVKIIELNTGCPAGFMHSQVVTETILEAARYIDGPIHHAMTGGCGDVDAIRSGAIDRDRLIDRMIELAACEEMPREGIVALVNDENGLLNELLQIQTSLAARGVAACVISADALEYREGRLFAQGYPVRLMYNKLRISTPHSPNHCWSPGFETRYHDFLAAAVDRAVPMLNGLPALTIAEDKGLLTVLSAPDFQAELSEADRSFIDTHIAATARLTSEPTWWCGEKIIPTEMVTAHRERFVLKPACEGRGFGVIIGRYATEEQWQRALRPNPDMPRVVQEHHPALELPVVPPVNRKNGDEHATEIVSMYGSVGLAVIGGKYAGLLSRVSPLPVNNVGRSGIVQAVWVR